LQTIKDSAAPFMHRYKQTYTLLKLP